jgi:homoserine O-acetyltransferase
MPRGERDPNWHGGDYYDTPGMGSTMQALRVETLKRYGMNASEAEIERIASAWAKEFDANSLLILGRAMELYDVTPELHRIRVPVLYALSRTDELFPPSLAPDVMGSLREAGVTADYFEIDSELGHLASGADAAKWAPALREFMERFVLTLAPSHAPLMEGAQPRRAPQITASRRSAATSSSE